ncbi:hypothetical protein CYMTET_21065 [Cymbomonas tetramitiformis]|uniref:Uncharacterized protein n=1 Tax=Cymbomonas tetramitiformis TaxID=36881 RepID=A0AAE0L3M5_9CHLO|nr:hypothetical protein CYMTET_21065 [Cymbomonas tetramitiformis]
MVHFDSATPAVIDEPTVGHEPKVAIENDDDATLYPQQFIDGEPPFEQSFMDNMSVQLGFNEPEQQNDTVGLFLDTASLDSGTAGFDNIFNNLDPGVLYSDTAKISGLADSIDNYNDNNELLSVDHFRGG